MEEEKEDAEMREMLELLETARQELDTTKEEDVLRMIEKLDDDAYFEGLKKEVKQKEAEALTNSNTVAAAVTPAATATGSSTAQEHKPEDGLSNKRRAEAAATVKEPSLKKSKESRRKKVLAAGGVSMFGGKDLFGGRNPFASRKQESTSDEEEEEDEEEQTTVIENTLPSTVNNNGGLAMQHHSIAIQPDAEERPVSFEEGPQQSHLIASSTKHRAALPSRRRPPARHGISSKTESSGSAAEANSSNSISLNGHHTAGDEGDEIKVSSAGAQERLGEASEYDGDEDTESHSTIRRGRRSIKRRPPPKGGVALFGGIDLRAGQTCLDRVYFFSPLPSLTAPKVP